MKPRNSLIQSKMMSGSKVGSQGLVSCQALACSSVLVSCDSVTAIDLTVPELVVQERHDMSPSMNFTSTFGCSMGPHVLQDSLPPCMCCM